MLAEDVDSLDPARATRPSSWFFLRALHRGLLAYPDAAFPDGARPAPDLADGEPTWNADRTALTVRLRGDLRFGLPSDDVIGAADVVASLVRLRDRGRGIASSFADVSDIRAANPRTVVLRTRRPMPELPWMLAHPQAAIVPATTPAPGVAAPSQIAGAGPYRLSRYAPERSLELERNGSWQSDEVRAAYVDRIEATMNVPLAAAVARIADGGADLIVDPGSPGQAAPEVPSSVHRVRVANGCVRYLFLDARATPLADRSSRVAIARAIQRDTVRARRAPAVRALPPTVFGHRTEPVIGEDIDAARATLANAGRSSGFAVRMLIASESRDIAEATALKRSLARARIAVTVDKGSAADVLVNRYPNRAQVVPAGLATWCADLPGLGGAGVLRALAGVRPLPGAAGRAVAAAIARAERAAVEDADQAWAAADEALVQAAGVIPLAWDAEDVLLSERIAGFTPAPMFPRGDPTGVWLQG